MVIILFLAAAVAQPSTEALRLGRQIAESGTLATLLPLIEEKETEELVASHPELAEKDKSRLRGTARRVYEAGRQRLMQAEAQSYARQLSIEDLRAIASFQRSRAGQRYRSAIPQVIASTIQQIGKMDFKADVLAAYCKDTGKLCDK